MSKPAAARNAPRTNPQAAGAQAPRGSAPAQQQQAAAASSTSPKQAAGGEELMQPNDEIRLLVDWHHVGAIIGKGGNSVKQIREESGCSINIIAPAPNAPSPQQTDRIMTVKGSLDQTTKAIYLIAHTIQARAQERKKSGQDSGNDRSSRQGQDAQDGTTAIKLLVHRAAVGAVIGKGGESIRATQAETGARIQVSSEPLGNSTDKSVTISGTPEVVETAVHKVLGQLLESPLRAATKTVHFVPGPAYFAYNEDGSQQPQQQQQQQQMPAHHAQQQQQHAPQGVAPAGASGPISIQKIAIPTICAGCVIGRGGLIIRNLRSQSGTNISIADPDPATPDERVVTITGTVHGIQTAVYLIRNCVESYVPPSHQQGGDENPEEQQHAEEQTQQAQ